MYKRKTIDLWDIIGDYSSGPEVLCTETSLKEAKVNLRAYRENCPEISYYCNKRRERIE